MYFKGRRTCFVTVRSGPVCSSAVTAVYSKKAEIEHDDILMWEWRPSVGQNAELNLTAKAFMHLG